MTLRYDPGRRWGSDFALQSQLTLKPSGQRGAYARPFSRASPECREVASTEPRRNAIDRDDYRDLCLEYGGGWDSIDTWLQLWDLLEPRHDHGWHFEFPEENPGPDEPGAIWCFGLADECLVVVRAAGELIVVYIHPTDDEFPVTSAVNFADLLPALEREHAGFSPIYLGLRHNLESKGDADLLRRFSEDDDQLRRQSIALGLDDGE